MTDYLEEVLNGRDPKVVILEMKDKLDNLSIDSALLDTFMKKLFECDDILVLKVEIWEILKQVNKVLDGNIQPSK